MILILPTAKEVRDARIEAGLTQKQCGHMVYVGQQTWAKWETDPSKANNRQITGAVWELFLIKTRKLRPATSLFVSPRH